jgi:hypothetical protein
MVSLRCINLELPMTEMGHFRQIDPLPTLSACPLRSDRVRTFAPQRFDAVVESRMGAVAWAMRQRSDSHPRSSYEPLVSYRINRQLSVWNLPPLMIRAFGARCQLRTCDKRATSFAFLAECQNHDCRGVR